MTCLHNQQHYTRAHTQTETCLKFQLQLDEKQTNKLYNSQTHVTFQRVISNAISTKWRRSKEHPHIGELNPTHTFTHIDPHTHTHTYTQLHFTCVCAALTEQQ